jgi:hypothetical protein
MAIVVESCDILARVAGLTAPDGNLAKARDKSIIAVLRSDIEDA